MAVGLLGTIAAIAVPYFSGFIERQKLAAQAAAISTSLSTARAEAITRLEDVEVCWNQTNAAITRNSFSIMPGQMVVMTDVDPAEVIRDIAFADDGLFINDTDADDCVSINPSGRFDTATATGGTLTFGICKEPGDTIDSKAVVMNATGRASTVDNKSGSASNCS